MGVVRAERPGRELRHRRHRAHRRVDEDVGVVLRDDPVEPVAQRDTLSLLAGHLLGRVRDRGGLFAHDVQVGLRELVQRLRLLRQLAVVAVEGGEVLVLRFERIGERPPRRVAARRLEQHRGAVRGRDVGVGRELYVDRDDLGAGRLELGDGGVERLDDLLVGTPPVRLVDAEPLALEVVAVEELGVRLGSSTSALRDHDLS